MYFIKYRTCLNFPSHFKRIKINMFSKFSKIFNPENLFLVHESLLLNKHLFYLYVEVDLHIA